MNAILEAWTAWPVILLVIGLGWPLPMRSQSQPSTMASHLGEKGRPATGVSGYLSGIGLNFLEILPPYPAIGSKEDDADVATLRQWQQPADSARFKLAQSDAQMSYSRFSGAFGTAISAEASPLLVHLLDRVEADLDAVGEAKQYYKRPRPYQRFQFDHVCDFRKAPAPNGSQMGDSYPSGHTAFGWTAALVLAAVAPEKAQAVLARGREYGESRLVCAAHYPSDVMGAEILATAAFERISASPEFQKDLACAQREHEKKPIGPACR